jgi:YgiT-type zinc finger domain-containing protein
VTFAEQCCAHCDSSRVLLEHVSRSFGRSDDLLVIEKIPMWSCSVCRESYFTAQTMHEIERIKVLRKSLAITKNVSVAVFEANGV